MKQLINLSITMLVLSFFTATIFAQSNNIKKNKNHFKKAHGQLVNSQRANWIDANGDGICDDFTTVKDNNNGHGYRLKDRRSAGIRLKNGTGFGRKSGVGIKIQNNKNGNSAGTGFGSGVCSGNGPKGSVRRGRQGTN